jgi:hypothetical protein
MDHAPGSRLPRAQNAAGIEPSERPTNPTLSYFPVARQHAREHLELGHWYRHWMLARLTKI